MLGEDGKLVAPVGPVAANAVQEDQELARADSARPVAGSSKARLECGTLLFTPLDSAQSFPISEA
jgi:hypothetical protein